MWAGSAPTGSSARLAVGTATWPTRSPSRSAVAEARLSHTPTRAGCSTARPGSITPAPPLNRLLWSGPTPGSAVRARPPSKPTGGETQGLASAPHPDPHPRGGRETSGRAAVKGVLQRGKVLDERGEVLTGDAQHAGVRHCADRGRPSSVAQQRELAEIVTGVQPANRPFPAVDLLQHLDFSGGDDVEPSAQLALAHDVLAGAESHRDHRIAPADWQRRQFVREHGGSHPVQHQGEPAPPGGHE